MMKHKKKILLGSLAVLTTTIVPIATIISCGSDKGKPVLKKVKAPTKAEGSITGRPQHGIYHPPTLTGTTVTWDPKKQQGSFKFNDKIHLTYTLNSGYIWSDSTTGVKKYTYTVPHNIPKIKVNIPKATTTTGTLSGTNGSGTYKYADLTGTTIKLAFTARVKNGILSNGNKITLTYTLKTGYIWFNNTTAYKTSTFTVKDLKSTVKKPTTSTASVKFTGTSGQGTFSLLEYKNTIVTITKGGSGTTPSTTLKNNDTITLSFVPNINYVWNTGGTTAVTLSYIVTGLEKIKVQVPNATTTTGTLSGTNGSGTYKYADLTGTTIKLAFTAGVKNGILSNEDKITLTYTLKTGYIWFNNTTADKTSTFTVKYLKSTVKKPTTSTASVKFTGTSGQGTFSLLEYKNTIVTITKGGSGTTPSTTLKNNDTITLSFVPNINYVWNTGGTTAVTLSYIVKNLKTIWHNDTKSELTNGSNITNGAWGSVFEDTNGNLWSMGSNTKLQVLPANNPTKWLSDTKSGLTNGSNITNGHLGKIFEDKVGNLWSMAAGTPLQVLKKGTHVWLHDIDKGLTNGSNLTDGSFGTIFQDKDGNIWSMANHTKLQVLPVNNPTKWVSDTKFGLTNGSNITDGREGSIIQDKAGNLWSMGDGTPLQVWKKSVKKWTHDIGSGLTNGSNITDGRSGTIFEDTNGNLWSMGNNTKLQVLPAKNPTKWLSSTASGLTNGSNITDGSHSTIFEDTNGNIWSMAFYNKLQVLVP